MINPVRIYGTWDEGIVLDNHMLKSVFLGYDEKGKEIFENTRTELGELIYKFKYQHKKNSLEKIITLIRDILDKWNIKEKIDIIIPVPPSNKKRKYQPVFEIANAIAEYLEKENRTDIIFKENDIQAKDGNNINGTIKQYKKLDKICNVLVIDDLYSTGQTLNEVCKVRREDINIKNIYCLVMTKTKGG